MKYAQNVKDAFEGVIGKEGADKKVFEASLAKAKKAIDTLRARKQDGSWPVLSVPERKDDLKLIEDTAKKIRKRFKALVVLGMGASSRGGSTLAALVENQFSHKGIRIHFVENIDPVSFDQLLDGIDFKKTMFLVISKSGGTVETLAQAFVLVKEVKARLGKKAVKDHFLFISEPKPNPLRELAQTYGIKTLEHDAKIGGRYSALTIVGLLPACVAGLDIRAIRRGALEALQHTFKAASPEPAIGAALHDALLKKGKTISVLMPYCDQLAAFNAWHQQLWEESLGKGGHGTTALCALGTTDQHSRLQLYLDGPCDKLITFLLLEQGGKGALIQAPKDNPLSYLGGHTIGDLMASAQYATAKTLTKNKRPVRIISLKKLDEATIGALMMHFMLETMIVAQLWNVNPFDQPAVEESKQLARKYLSKN